MQPVQLLIEIKADGQLYVTGPIDNPIVCYGLLESAKDVIRERAAEGQTRVVRPAPAGLKLT